MYLKLCYTSTNDLPKPKLLLLQIQLQLHSLYPHNNQRRSLRPIMANRSQIGRDQPRQTPLSCSMTRTSTLFLRWTTFPYRIPSLGHGAEAQNRSTQMRPYPQCPFLVSNNSFRNQASRAPRATRCSSRRRSHLNHRVNRKSSKWLHRPGRAPLQVSEHHFQLATQCQQGTAAL